VFVAWPQGHYVTPLPPCSLGQAAEQPLSPAPLATTMAPARRVPRPHPPVSYPYGLRSQGRNKDPISLAPPGEELRVAFMYFDLAGYEVHRHPDCWVVWIYKALAFSLYEKER
jgi:hypothetical protein